MVNTIDLMELFAQWTDTIAAAGSCGGESILFFSLPLSAVCQHVSPTFFTADALEILERPQTYNITSVVAIIR